MTNPKKNISWIVCHDGSRRPFGCECLRCGAYDQIGLPVDLSVLTVRLRMFSDQHRGCKDTEERTDNGTRS